MKLKTLDSILNNAHYKITFHICTYLPVDYCKKHKSLLMRCPCRLSLEDTLVNDILCIFQLNFIDSMKMGYAFYDGYITLYMITTKCCYIK